MRFIIWNYERYNRFLLHYLWVKINSEYAKGRGSVAMMKLTSYENLEYEAMNININVPIESKCHCML